MIGGRNLHFSSQARVTALVTEIGGIIGRMDEISGAMSTTVEQQSVTAREIAGKVTAVSGAPVQSAHAMSEVVLVAGQAGTASREVVAGTAGIDTEVSALCAEVERFLVMVRTDSGERRRVERFGSGDLKGRLFIPGQHPILVEVMDLSEGGAAVRSDQPITVGTELSFELVEGGGKVPANVIRVSSGGVLAIAFSDNEKVGSQIRRAMETEPWSGALLAA